MGRKTLMSHKAYVMVKGCHALMFMDVSHICTIEYVTSLTKWLDLI